VVKVSRRGLYADFMTWLMWAVLSALFAAATALLAKAGVAHVDPNLATAIRTSVVVVFAWMIALSLGSHAGLMQVERRSWVFLVASGLATGLSWICYFRALSMGEASKVAPIDKLSVVFVVLLAWPLLGETITWAKGAGVLLIAAGAIVLAWA
jgi:bacterial/archaeal transporter family protein